MNQSSGYIHNDNFLSPSVEIDRTFEYDYQKTIQKCNLNREYIMAVGNVFKADTTKYEYPKHKNIDITQDIEDKFNDIDNITLSL